MKRLIRQAKPRPKKKELVFTTKHHFECFSDNEDIAKDIPLVDIALEKEKWGQGNVNSMNTYISILKKRLNWLDKEYFKI